jgi:isoleucyl-tRNA synthetase
MLAELSATASGVVERMDAFDHFAAAGMISSLVDGVSNWFVRRSRDRFWGAGRADSPQGNPDKLDAYWTLYETLLGVARLAAPFVPFVSETIWRNLAVGRFGDKVAESIHLTDYPQGAPGLLDADLVRRMTLVREVASLGRAARSSAKLKVRQPLSKVEVILADTSPDDAAWLAAHAELVCDELNVKQFEICREPDRYITRSVLPDLKKLGPRLGKLLPQARDALTKADAQALLAGFARDGRVELSLPGGTATVERDDVLIRTTPREGWAAAEGTQAVVVVAAGLTPELIAEGLAREVVHAVQTARKGLDLEFTDTIDLAFETASADLRSALEHHRDSIASETLAAAIHFGPGPAGASAETIDVDGHPLTIHIQALERQKDRA